MSGKVLENLAKELPQEELVDKIRENFRILGSQQYLQGAQLLVDQLVTNAQTVSSTSYVVLSNFKFGITCSGGLITICPNIFIVINGQTVTVGLFVDDEDTPRFEQSKGNTNNINDAIAFSQSVKLGAGKHVITMKAKVDGGSCDLGGTTFAKSSFQITEILGG